MRITSLLGKRRNVQPAPGAVSESPAGMKEGSRKAGQLAGAHTSTTRTLPPCAMPGEHKAGRSCRTPLDVAVAARGVQAGARQAAVPRLGWDGACGSCSSFTHKEFYAGVVFMALQLATAQHQGRATSPGTLLDGATLPGMGRCQAASAASSKRGQGAVLPGRKPRLACSAREEEAHLGDPIRKSAPLPLAPTSPCGRHDPACPCA